MMDALEVHYDSPPAHWDEIVCRLNGSIYQSSAWAEYERKRSGSRPIYLLMRNARGEEAAGSLAFFQCSKRPLLSRIFREFRLPAHPFVGNGVASSDIARFIEGCEGLAQRMGCSRLSIDSFLSGQSLLVPSELGYTENPRLEFVMDLRGTLEDAWRGLRKDHRERIRRLKREGVRVETATQGADLDGLKLAREMTQARRKDKGQAYKIEHSEGLYDRLQGELLERGLGRLLTAKRGEEILGSICFLTFNGRANSIFSGSTVGGYKMGVQTLLFWSAVEAFKADGFQELNRGGIPASAERESDPLHGIYLFKSRLGTTPQLCRSGHKIIRPFRDRLSRLRETFWH